MRGLFAQREERLARFSISESRVALYLRAVKRRVAAVGALLTVALGLASRRLPVGFSLWDKSAGDVLYAVLVYFVLAFARPSLGPRALAAASLGVSLVVETFQLTGVPARLPRLAQLVLGTTFAWHDVACYAVGAVGAGAVHALSMRGRSEQG